MRERERERERGRDIKKARDGIKIDGQWKMIEEQKIGQWDGDRSIKKSMCVCVCVFVLRQWVPSPRAPPLSDCETVWPQYRGGSREFKHLLKALVNQPCVCGSMPSLYLQWCYNHKMNSIMQSQTCTHCKHTQPKAETHTHTHTHTLTHHITELFVLWTLKVETCELTPHIDRDLYRHCLGDILIGIKYVGVFNGTFMYHYRFGHNVHWPAFQLHFHSTTVSRQSNSQRCPEPFIKIIRLGLQLANVNKSTNNIKK